MWEKSYRKEKLANHIQINTYLDITKLNNFKQLNLL